MQHEYKILDKIEDNELSRPRLTDQEFASAEITCQQGQSHPIRHDFSDHY